MNAETLKESNKQEIDNNELIKEFEQDYEDNKYKLKIEIEKNKELVKFELRLISKISNNIFEKIYKYENIIEYFNISKNRYHDIMEIYEEIKQFKIIYKEDNFIIIKLNNIHAIILNKIKKDNKIINSNAINNTISQKNKKIIDVDKSINLRNSIHSRYIKKNIFSYLNNKRELNLIKYNKTYQKELGINIQDYKLLSKKYLIIEKNGTCKEYKLNTNKLIFEGEFKNGKKNGKAKEYFNEEIIFEGEYINGKRSKGKEYYYYDNYIKFEGEYLNGKQWTGKGYNSDNKLEFEIKNGEGIIKEYNKGGDLIYEGEYLNGEKNGKGKEYYYNGKLEFEGEYLNNKKWNGIGYDQYGQIDYELKNGNGKIKEKNYAYDNEYKYEGEYLNGDRYEKCKEYDCKKNLIYDGEYLNGKRHGKGKEYYFGENLLYEGEYLNGERNGKGKEYDINGKIIFEGEYLNENRWNGNGKEYIYYDRYDDGKLIFEGEFFNGKRHGKGKEYYNYDMDLFTGLERFEYFIKLRKERDINIIKYEGEYLNGEKNGKGKEYYKNGKLKFEGEYLKDKLWNVKGYNINGNLDFEIKNGKGFIKEYYYDGKLIFEGEYLNGERNGKGKEYNKDGDLIYEGEYLNGERNGKGKEYYKNGKLKFEGEYLNDKKWNFKGYNINGKIEFEIKNGKGTIKEYDNNGKLIFEGEYLNGEKNGIGKEYCDDKIIFEGEYKNNAKNGKGKEYYQNSNLKFEGEYLNGERKGEGKEYDENGKFIRIVTYVDFD